MEVPKSVYLLMIEHCRVCLPYEACGLLSGNDQSIKSIWPLKNEWKSTNHYFVSKKVVEETVLNINHIGEQVLAVYHSHPTTMPVPSFNDLRNHPSKTIKMVIVSFKTSPPLLKCFDITGNSYEECPFLIDPPF